jgi:hypothetical protein
VLGFDFHATRGTDDFGFDLRASCGPDDSSYHLLASIRLASGHPTSASRAVSWCGLRLSRGSSTSDVDPRGYQQPKLYVTATLSPVLIGGQLCRNSTPLSCPIALKN